MKNIVSQLTFCLLTFFVSVVFAMPMQTQSEAPSKPQSQTHAQPEAPVLTKQQQDINYLQDAALRGDNEAQAALGDIYARGESRPRDWNMAQRWYEAAANNNNTYAQYMLGLIYQLGLTGPSQASLANQWYMRADSHKNSPRAKRLVGQFFADYDNPHYNPEQAFLWYESAARAGDIEAQDTMGDIYLQGKWVTKDVLSAVKWYGKAAAQRSPYAQYSLGQLFLNGDPSFPKDYSQALGWFYQAAVQCFVAAQFVMGDLYYEGNGVKQNNMQAYAWWSLAQKISDTPATFQPMLDRVTRKMSIEELQLANRLAGEYIQEYGSYCQVHSNPYLQEYMSRHGGVYFDK